MAQPVVVRLGNTSILRYVQDEVVPNRVHTKYRATNETVGVRGSAVKPVVPVPPADTPPQQFTPQPPTHARVAFGVGGVGGGVTATAVGKVEPAASSAAHTRALARLQADPQMLLREATRLLKLQDENSLNTPPWASTNQAQSPRTMERLRRGRAPAPPPARVLPEAPVLHATRLTLPRSSHGTEEPKRPKVIVPIASDRSTRPAGPTPRQTKYVTAAVSAPDQTGFWSHVGAGGRPMDPVTPIMLPSSAAVASNAGLSKLPRISRSSISGDPPPCIEVNGVASLPASPRIPIEGGPPAPRLSNSRSLTTLTQVMNQHLPMVHPQPSVPKLLDLAAKRQPVNDAPHAPRSPRDHVFYLRTEVAPMTAVSSPMSGWSGSFRSLPDADTDYGSPDESTEDSDDLTDDDSVD